MPGKKSREAGRFRKLPGLTSEYFLSTADWVDHGSLLFCIYFPVHADNAAPVPPTGVRPVKLSNYIAAMADVITRQAALSLHDPMCLIYFVLAAAYLLAILVTLRWGHARTWLCYLLVAAAYVAAAVVHGLPHP
jgi:hypothetical protein